MSEKNGHIAAYHPKCHITIFHRFEVNSIHMKNLLLCSLMLAYGALSAQSITLKTGTANSAFPFAGFPGLFYKNYNPFFETSYGYDLKRWEKSKLTSEISLSYLYHRFVQHGFPLQYETRWQYTAFKIFEPYAGLGAGYMLAIPTTGRLQLNDEGFYEKVSSIGRSQIAFNLHLGTDIKTRYATFLVEYKIMMQAPFVKSYVPLLPYNILQAGVRFNLGSSKKD